MKALKVVVFYFLLGSTGAYWYAYCRFLKLSNNITVSNFLIKTQKRVLEIPRKVQFESNDIGLILIIGSRKTVNYVRIYQKKHNNYLRFEHEFKSKKKIFYFLNNPLQ